MNEEIVDIDREMSKEIKRIQRDKVSFELADFEKNGIKVNLQLSLE